MSDAMENNGGVDPEKASLAERLKEEANEFFKTHFMPQMPYLGKVKPLVVVTSTMTKSEEPCCSVTGNLSTIHHLGRNDPSIGQKLVIGTSRNKNKISQKEKSVLFAHFGEVWEESPPCDVLPFRTNGGSHVFMSPNKCLLKSNLVVIPEKMYEKAIEMYTKAIEANPNVAAYYGNRSFAHLKTECFGYALEDASKSLELDKNYLKGYYRRATAYMSLGKFKQALRDYETVKKARPNDKDAQMKFIECNKIVKKIAFERAIAVEDTKSIADTIDLESIVIEDEYTGPKLDNDKVTLEFMKCLMEHYKDQKKLHRKYAYKILVDVKQLFMAQPSLVEITVEPDAKFTVCGDIHGQFYDLMNIFELNGLPSETNPYLFNGDFVDRGSFSVECIFTLFGFKLLYPNHFFMSRGNHESQTMNQMYGFEGEVKSKYTSQMAEFFTEVYNWLPLAHCINGRVLIMHGGLFSTDNVTLDDIRKIDRNRQPPEEGLMCDLLWSDPQPNEGRAPSKRGVGVQFGPDVTSNFLKLNKLDYIIRSHEVKNDGYEEAHDGKCITVFSAPNYCDQMGNKGAFITLDGKTMKPKYTVYDAVPHPDVKAMAFANLLMHYAF